MQAELTLPPPDAAAALLVQQTAPEAIPVAVFDAAELPPADPLPPLHLAPPPLIANGANSWGQCDLLTGTAIVVLRAICDDFAAVEHARQQAEAQAEQAISQHFTTAVEAWKRDNPRWEQLKTLRQRRRALGDRLATLAGEEASATLAYHEALAQGAEDMVSLGAVAFSARTAAGDLRRTVEDLDSTIRGLSSSLGADLKQRIQYATTALCSQAMEEIKAIVVELGTVMLSRLVEIKVRQRLASIQAGEPLGRWGELPAE